MERTGTIMGWKTLWGRLTDSGEKKLNRKRNTVTSVGGRAAVISGRRVNRAVTSVLVAVLAGVIGILLWLTLKKAGEELLYTNPEYRLAKIDIVSDGQRVSPDKVRQWAGIEAGMNMHTLDIGKMRKELLMKVPVIKAVVIRRILPDRIEIRLSERLPIACLGLHRLLGVDQTGYVFNISPPRTPMPVILGNIEPVSPGNRLHGRLLNAVEVVDVLNRTPLGGLMRVEVLDVREADFLMLRLTEGPVVSLSWQDMAMSTPESRLYLEGKLRSLARVLDDARSKNRRLIKVDLTFNDDYIPVE
jgi:hypothetical protein